MANACGRALYPLIINENPGFYKSQNTLRVDIHPKERFKNNVFRNCHLSTSFTLSLYKDHINDINQNIVFDSL